MNDDVLFNDGCHDELAQLLEDPYKNSRHDIWLWLYLSRHHNARFPPASCNGLTMRDEIATFLKRKPTFLNKIASKKDDSLVQDDHLKWIGGDERQCRWLLNRIETITGFGPLRGQPHELPHLTGRKHLIAILDLWEANIADKTKEIEYLRQDWFRHKANDSAFIWFEDKKEGVQRCQCAREWLEKNYSSLFGRQLLIGNLGELLIFFDKENLAPYIQRAIIQQIRRKWNRKQFDERTAHKKQVNVMLSKSVITQLDQLAKKHELKRAQVLELLITAESETGIYLDEDRNPANK